MVGRLCHAIDERFSPSPELLPVYNAIVRNLATYLAALRKELNAQFLTVFFGYFALSMVSFCILELLNYPDQSALNYWSKMLMRSAQQASLFVLLFTINPLWGRRFHLVLICLVFPSFIINIGHYLLYESLVHSGALGAIFFASFHEMDGYVQTFGPNIIFALVPIAIAFPFFWRFRFDKIGRKPRALCLTIFVLMLSIQTVSAMISASKSSENFWEKTASHMTRRAYESTFLLGNDVSTVYTFGREYYKFSKAREQMKNAGFDATLEEGAPELVVMVVGESLARSHLSLYGYERNTTPRLKERLEADDLLVFEDVIATTNLTRLTLMRALTLATHDDREPFYRGESIVAAARSAGYDTFWISNAGMLTPHDTEHTALARQADVTEMVNTDFRLDSLDEKLLPVFEDVLEHPAERKLVVLHTLGSHPKYDQRYAEDDQYYDENDELPEGVPELSDWEREQFDQYDNTIRYTDTFLDMIISRVEAQDKNAFFLYFSDHGQDLYELPERRLGHAHPRPSKYEMEVPMFAWTSEAYREQNPRVYEHLSGSLSAPLSTTYLFDTMVDLMRIESEEWTGDKSLVQRDPPDYDRHIISPDERGVFIYDPETLIYE